MNTLLPNIQTGNIIELNGLIYERAKLVYGENLGSTKKPEQKYKTWMEN